jgi:hypothetical protein
MEGYLRQKVVLFPMIGLVSAAALAKGPPDELLYRSQPIDPLVLEFNGDRSRFDPQDLAGRGTIQELEGFRIIRREAPAGFHGYEYTYDGANQTCYSYYQYLGRIDTSIVILSLSASGGTGRFSRVHFLERKGDMIRLVKDGPGGDRASGITDARIVGNQLAYTKGLTPVDLVALVDKDYLEQDHGLASCAICRAAVAHYLGDRLLHVDLAASDAAEGSDADPAAQGIFQRLCREYAAAGRRRLSLRQLNQFVREFKARCQAANPGPVSAAEGN